MMQPLRQVLWSLWHTLVFLLCFTDIADAVHSNAATPHLGHAKGAPRGDPVSDQREKVELPILHPGSAQPSSMIAPNASVALSDAVRSNAATPHLGHAKGAPRGDPVSDQREKTINAGTQQRSAIGTSTPHHTAFYARSTERNASGDHASASVTPKVDLPILHPGSAQLSSMIAPNASVALSDAVHSNAATRHLAPPRGDPVSDQREKTIDAGIQQRSAINTSTPHHTAVYARSTERDDHPSATEVDLPMLHLGESQLSSIIALRVSAALSDGSWKHRARVSVLAFPDSNRTTYTKKGEKDPKNEKDRGEEELDPKQQRGEFFGLPKMFWALALTVVAMFVFVAGIPATLYLAKRRRVA